MTLPEELAQQGLALRRLAARLVGDPDVADDVVQDAWVRALERPPEKRAAARAWLRRVVHGLSVDALRARARRRRVEGPLGEPSDVPQAGAARGIELQLAVLEAVRALPEPYRQTVWQRFFEDRPPRDIAAAAKIPVKTVKTRLHRALGMLRARLDAEHGGEQRAWALPLLAMISPEPVGLAAGAVPPAVASSVPPTFALWSLWMKSSAIRLTAAVLVLCGGLAVGWSLLGPRDGPAPVTGADAAASRSVSLDRSDAPEMAASAPGTAPDQTELDRRALDAATPDPSTGSFALRVLWHDREPAPDIGVSLRGARGKPRVVFASGATGADGRVRFEGLDPGTFLVRTDRHSGWGMDPLEVEVVAGTTVEQELVLERGVDVEGVVVRSSGAPVAGAGVWLQTFYLDWSGGRVVARTGDDGRFALRSVPAGASLAALAAPGGHDAPSAFLDLDLVETTDGVAQVRLELGPAGGRVVGRVVDLASGRPLPGARIAFGERRRNMDSRGDRVIEQWSPRTVHTDDEGRFAFDGLAPGELPYTAVHDGHGIVRGSVAVEAEQTVALDVALPAAATVFGRVLGDDGAGRPGASVFAYDSEPGTSFIQGGQIDFDKTFGYVGTITGPDGSFRLPGVTPGTAHLIVQEPRPERPTSRDSASGRAYVHEVMSVEPGVEVEWNPVLADGHVIEGRALYRDGHPLTGQFVSLRTPAGDEAGTLLTDLEGRFRFVCLTGPLYHIYVQVFDQPRGSPPVELTNVVPDRGPVEVRATFDRPTEQKPAQVTGSVLDDGQRLTNPRGASVLLVTESNSWYTSQLDEDGRFEFERVDPGQLRLVVMDGDTAVYHGEPFDVAPAERRDVGTLTTTADVAAVRVTLQRGEGTEKFEPSLSLRLADGRRGASVKPGTASTFEIGNLTPGDYKWSLYCKGAVSRSGTVTLQSGTPAALAVELTAGALCKFDVQFSADADLGELTIVYEREGIEAGRYTYRPGSALDFRRYYVGRTLPPGEWRAVMTTTTGMRAEARFTIRSVDDRPEPVLELR